MYYCKECLRLYKKESLVKSSLTSRLYSCPIHNIGHLYRLTYSDEFIRDSEMYVQFHHYFVPNNLIKENDKMQYIDISKLKSSDLLFLRRVFDF